MKAAVADEDDDPGNRDESPAAVRARQVAALKELFNSPLVKAITGAGYAPQILLDDLPAKPKREVLLDDLGGDDASPSG